MLLAAVAVTSDSTKDQDDDAGEADEEGQATAARVPDASRSSLRIIRVSVDDGGSSPAMELVQTIEVGERCSSAQHARHCRKCSLLRSRSQTSAVCAERHAAHSTYSRT